MSDNERIASLETKVEGLTNEVRTGIADIKGMLKDAGERSDRRHGEHYKKNEDQAIALEKVNTTISVMKWVIGIGLSVVSVASALGLIKKL